MKRKTLAYLMLLAAMSSGLALGEAGGLPEAVQNARQAVTAATDSASREATLAQLLGAAQTYPTSSLIPEAFWLAARLHDQSGRRVEAVELCKRVVMEYPASESAPGAFEFAWRELTSNGAQPEAAVELAARMCDGLADDPSASRYYPLTAEGYSRLSQWREETLLAESYLRQSASWPQDAPLLLSLSEAALLAGNTPVAQVALERFVERFPTLPQIVPVRVKLASILTASGKESLAREHYSLAWSTYQKQRGQSAYSQADVCHSAAAALWALQNDARREFEAVTAFDAPFNESRARKLARSLTDSYEQAMLADQSLAPQCLNATGDVYARMGDVLLKEGFALAAGGWTSRSKTPCTDALEEYGRAVASYAFAYERALMESDRSGSARTASHYAAEQALGVSLGEGDAVFAWALRLAERAPQADPGAGGGQKRFDYLLETVTPYLYEALEHKNAALNLVARWPVQEEAAAARAALDLPLRSVAADLADLRTLETRAAAASSAHLAQSVKMGLRNSSTESLTDAAVQSFMRAAYCAARTDEAWDELYLRLDRAGCPNHAFWDSLMVTAQSDYATLCRSVGSESSVCSASLAASKDEMSGRLARKLSDLQSRAADEELASLVRWHDFASRYSVDHPLNDKLGARLAELDPLKYGSPDNTPSASRRKP